MLYTMKVSIKTERCFIVVISPLTEYRICRMDSITPSLDLLEIFSLVNSYSLYLMKTTYSENIKVYMNMNIYLKQNYKQNEKDDYSSERKSYSKNLQICNSFVCLVFFVCRFWYFHLFKFVRKDSFFSPKVVFKLISKTTWYMSLNCRV
jgi:hypothetical protein